MMTKQNNEQPNLLQPDRVASGINWNKHSNNSLCNPVDHQASLALVGLKGLISEFVKGLKMSYSLYLL